MKIRCFSLTQPWASAMAYGLKSIETRDRKQSHRGQLAIHAARFDPRDSNSAAFFDEVKPYFRGAGFLGGFEDLPFGAIVALATMIDVLPAETLRERIGHTELLFGNYANGRYGYQFEGVGRLLTPVPARGMPGLWTWDAGGVDFPATTPARRAKRQEGS